MIYCIFNSCVYTITFFAECGLAPTVTLTCANGSTHVDWVASKPGCQNDCKAHWTCTNGTDHYNDKVHSLPCIISMIETEP